MFYSIVYIQNLIVVWLMVGLWGFQSNGYVFTVAACCGVEGGVLAFYRNYDDFRVRGSGDRKILRLPYDLIFCCHIGKLTKTTYLYSFATVA